jgi:hypothetical protein
MVCGSRSENRPTLSLPTTKHNGAGLLWVTFRPNRKPQSCASIGLILLQELTLNRVAGHVAAYYARNPLEGPRWQCVMRPVSVPPGLPLALENPGNSKAGPPRLIRMPSLARCRLIASLTTQRYADLASDGVKDAANAVAEKGGAEMKGEYGKLLSR